MKRLLAFALFETFKSNNLNNVLSHIQDKYGKRRMIQHLERICEKLDVNLSDLTDDVVYFMSCPEASELKGTFSFFKFWFTSNGSFINITTSSLNSDSDYLINTDLESSSDNFTFWVYDLVVRNVTKDELYKNFDYAVVLDVDKIMRNNYPSRKDTIQKRQSFKTTYDTDTIIGKLGERIDYKPELDIIEKIILRYTGYNFLLFSMVAARGGRSDRRLTSFITTVCQNIYDVYVDEGKDDDFLKHEKVQITNNLLHQMKSNIEWTKVISQRISQTKKFLKDKEGNLRLIEMIEELIDFTYQKFNFKDLVQRRPWKGEKVNYLYGLHLLNMLRDYDYAISQIRKLFSESEFTIFISMLEELSDMGKNWEDYQKYLQVFEWGHPNLKGDIQPIEESFEKLKNGIEKIAKTNLS